MKNGLFLVSFIFAFVLASCSSQSDDSSSQIVPEVYSLERTEDEVWQINADAEYYDYFNKIHQTYALLLKDATDPAEIRRLFIERDLKIAEKRLEHMADTKLVKKVVHSTESSKGANASGHLFRMQDVYHVPWQAFTPKDPATYTYKEVDPGVMGGKGTDAMTAIIQFDRQMKERGINLIVVPVPNSTQVYAHELSNDLHLEDVVWHPWAHMIVKLLEYDVEVLDLLDLYKTYSGDNTTLNYYDHHWAHAGMEIVSREIAQRLERFSFDAKYYIDPDDIKVTPIKIPTPELIPYWDNIDMAFLTSRMPYSPQYDTVEILYKGAKIDKAPSFEDSPVLIMGDSFIFHAEETSSGIYAHLAYYTHIIPAAYSRNAGAAAPPGFFKQYVAGKGKEPNVVIWEIYGSAFNSVTNLNNWNVVSLPEPVDAPSNSGVRIASDAKLPDTEGSLSIESGRNLEWVEGEVTRVSEIPETEDLAYPDALYAYQIRITDDLSSRMEEGKTVTVYSQYLFDLDVDKDKILSVGDKRHFYLEDWMDASSKTEKIGTMQLVDDLDDFESDVYFAHLQRSGSGSNLAKLNKTYLEKDPGALTFQLKGLKLIESIKASVHHNGSGPARFNIETSLDGTNWFSLYECMSTGDGDDTEVITLESVHPASFVRFTGPSVKADIPYDNTLENTDGFSGIEIYGY